MNPTLPYFQVSTSFPNSPPPQLLNPANQTSLKPHYGSMLSEALGQQVIDMIPLISAQALRLFDQETVVLPYPYLPNVSHNSLDDYVLPQSRTPHFIHVAQGISPLGRSFLALKVNVTTGNQHTFDMVEVVLQKNPNNSEEFVGLPNNTTSFHGGAISSIYDGEVIKDSSAQLLKTLINGETIKSPIAERYGLSCVVKAV